MLEAFSKLTALLRRRRNLNEDLACEIDAHVSLRMDDNIARGMAPDEARSEARRHFGNAALTRENAREAWQFPRLESFLQDLRYGLRGLRRSPGFSIAVILTLALGIGANIAIFSVVYNVLLRPLPYPNGERLLSLGESAGKASGISVTWINFRHWRDECRAFEEMAAYTQSDLTLTGHGEATLTHASLVTPAFFRLTGSHAQTGRLFVDADDRAGAQPVAILSREFWIRAFGADPAVLNTTLALNGKAYTVIGVLGAGRRIVTGRADYYLPLGPSAGKTTNRAAHGSIRVLALLKPGLTLPAGRKNLNEIMKRLAVSDPGPESDHRAHAEFLTDSLTGDIRQTLLILMGAAGLLLLIACANVASLLLVRGTARTRELAIRTAIGAGRARMARQLVTENLALSALGGGLGILLAGLCLRVLLKLAPVSIPRLADITLNLPVFCFAAAATVLTVLLAGLAPVFASTRMNVSGALKDGASNSGRSPGGQRSRSALVVAEIAITMVLAFASGLLIRSLVAAQSTDPGFDPHHLLSLELQLPSSAYKGDAVARGFYDRLMEDLRHVAGVGNVGAVTCPPGEGDCGDWWYSVSGRPAPARADVPLTLFSTADPAYFRTMGIRLLAGREFTAADRAGAPAVAIVNEDIARKWWPAPHAAIGQHIKFGGPFMEGNLMEIVGVAANVSQMGLDQEVMPQMYFPFAQEGSHGMAVVLRTAGDPAAVIPAVRRRVAALDRNLPIQSLSPLEEQLSASLDRRRFSTLLLSVFAALAMLLAATGVYGVLNYWVSVRIREIAVRMALGARRASILRWAGSHALRLTIAGIVIGAAGSWGVSRWLTGIVFGVSARSPLTMALAAAMVIALAGVASWLPVWRASRVNVSRNLHEG